MMEKEENRDDFTLESLFKASDYALNLFYKGFSETKSLKIASKYYKVPMIDIGLHIEDIKFFALLNKND